MLKQYMYERKNIIDKGIIIKKDNQFFEMKMNVLFNKSKKSIETKLQPISEESLKLFCKGKS